MTNMKDTADVHSFKSGDCLLYTSDAGYKVPEDISLTGFDGVEIGKYVIPSLTTLKQPVDSMARETARILFDIIGKKAKHQHCVFDGELVVRDSTMPRT